MNSRKRRQENLRAYCAQWHPDDGIDPRDDKRRDAAHNEKPNRKLFQLCKQVQRALQLAMDMVPQLAVMAVQIRDVAPAPDAGRLCAVVAVPAAERAAAEVLIHRYAGRLRAEAADAISRRRAPELVFQVVVTGDRDE